ncbi:helix-turn-helix domain-containing protein [Meiothermus taiwanensis]|jgi:hypothetical protein|uniref:Helix-turn-helix domain-containing protein n=1 Tax=Meiothermus taiwanensis WR-220 TaxID=1339250 RepID=A0ABN5LYI9_9DEIN|nr:helix-turn-helix domain-containing protein [Meiothermus taiwanensis]AWR87048.1 hypothetical protein Mtai_v1c18140 [Meiothermus taiwanensis WR-220]KIQ54374.1 hypothetical protein SY28_09040 [Meiothermus taiwanensis]KZK15067.1 hypothetical protein A3962_11715 [Meiothermus taiwanensis]
MNNMTPSLHIDSKTLTQAVVQDIARHIPDKTTFTVDELAEFLGLDRKVVYASIQCGNIQKLPFKSKRWLIPRGEVVRLLLGRLAA